MANSFSRLGREIDRRTKIKEMPPIERNATLLADLEREWCVLGPLRPITFSVRIEGDVEGTRKLAREAELLGFDTVVATGQVGDTWLHATRAMEPTADNVTNWEGWFCSRLDSLGWDDEGHHAYYEGWRYPKRVAPSFDARGHEPTNGSANERGQVLFGQALSYDPIINGHWHLPPEEGSDTYSSLSKAPPFRFAPSQFLKRARANPPQYPEPSASKFSQWLYSLYADAYGSEQDRDGGREVEEEILAVRRRVYTGVDANVLSTSFPEWGLLHNGMHNAQSERPDYFSISDLMVAGEALRVLPDLIYQNGRTGEIIVVEIKHSYMGIPSNLWPNIWGQLWCYAQLELVRRAPRVTVVGEVWGDAWTRGSRKQSGNHFVCLRASVRRDPRAPAYDRFFRALFDIYRGAH